MERYSALPPELDRHPFCSSCGRVEYFTHIGCVLMSHVRAGASVLTAILDGSLQFALAERCAAVLFDERGEVSFSLARHRTGRTLSADAGALAGLRSRLSDLQPLWLDLESSAAPFGSSGAPRAAVALPLVKDEVVSGILYLDDSSDLEGFRARVSSLSDCLSRVVSLAAQTVSIHTGPQCRPQPCRPAACDSEFDFIIGRHPAMVGILKLVNQVADTDAPVLIHGETGTGKELIARALHIGSSRRNQPLVAVNCGALPHELLESELFGHRRGAFTGAIRDKRGLIDEAHGGTLFLDEIAEMPLHLQVKLLRVLQTHDYRALGATESAICDARILSATSRSLEQLMATGEFREEMFYRLNVVEIKVPPLRERQSDIPLLATHFLGEYGRRYNKASLRLSNESVQLLVSHKYPGNVRELESLIHRAVLFAQTDGIEPSHFPSLVQTCVDSGEGPTADRSFRSSKQHVVEEFERNYILRFLESSQGNISNAARAAGMDIKNFHVKMRRYGIMPHVFKSNIS